MSLTGLLARLGFPVPASALSRYKPGDRVVYRYRRWDSIPPRLATVYAVNADMPQSGFVWVNFDEGHADFTTPPYGDDELDYAEVAADWDPNAHENMKKWLESPEGIAYIEERRKQR